jgi:hypothetical protein
MHDAQVPAVPAITAPLVFWSVFEQERRRASLARCNGGAKPGVSSTHNQNIIDPRWVGHVSLRRKRRPKQDFRADRRLAQEIY